MIKACIFDLDGVLADTARYHFIAWKKLADELKIPFTESDNERLKGVGRMDSLDILLSLGGVTFSDVEKQQLATRKNKWFADLVNEMTPDKIFPGVVELLQQLRFKNIKVGLASSSKNARAVLQMLKLENHFDTIVDGYMAVIAKPSPELFLLAAKRLQVDASDCVVFEDAKAGVEAARRAGMKCVGVGSADLLCDADFIVKQIADFKLSDLEKL